jgi:PAS domain S-box-containing protein
LVPEKRKMVPHENEEEAQRRQPLNPAFAAHLRASMRADGKVDYDGLLALINAAYDQADQDRAQLARRIESLEADLGEEQRFREMAGSASDWFWETDPRYDLTYVSERIGLSLGIKPAALIGLSYFDLGLDEHDPGLAARHRQDITERQPFRDLQFRIGPATGSDARIIRISGVPVFAEDGSFAGYRGVGADVTREASAELEAEALRRENEVRMRTEAALRASRERFISIADSLFESVVVVNRNGDIVFVNASLRKLLGLGEDELEGLPLDALLKVAVEGEPVLFADSPLAQLWSGRGPIRDDDAAIVTADGRTLPVAYANAPIREDGQSRNMVISFRDITALKEAQWEAMQASRLASVGQLAAGIAHEINTPIQYIGNNLRFIGDSLEKMATFFRAPTPDEALKRDIDFVLQELPAAVAESLDGVEQISRIVMSMKEFSHPGSSAKAMADLNHALETTLTVTRNVWRHSAEIVRAFDPDLPPVCCHAGELNQVFLNLIVNAAQAIEMSGKPLPGTITVSTRLAGEDVEIAVADSGTGIPPAIRDKIFDPFFTTKPVGKGTGQGLAICRDVVMVKHGGSLTVESEEGAGATFIVRLPLRA